MTFSPKDGAHTLTENGTVIDQESQSNHSPKTISRTLHTAGTYNYALTYSLSGESVTYTARVVVTPPPPPKPTCTLTANPTSITGDESSTLHWTTTNATSATIDQGIGAVTPVAGGSTSVSPTSNTTYTLTATGTGGTVTCHAAVTIVTNPKPTCTLTAAPTSIAAGDSSTLHWTTTNATSATIDQGIGAVTPAAAGSTSVSPATTTTYTLTATGAGGTVTCPATVTITAHTAPTCTLTANPTSITNGSSSALHWTTTNADTFSIDHGIGSVTPVASGSTSVSPTSDTTYTGTATGPGGTVTCHAAITVTTPQPNEPSCTLSASPTTLNAGDHTALTWTTTNADTFSIDQGIGAVTPAASGTVQSLAVNDDTTFTGTARSPNGHTATCTAAVTINHGGGGGGPTCTMTISPSSYTTGGSATLTWGGSDIHNVDIDNNIATGTSSPGSTVVAPTTGTYTYTGTFHANNGQTLTCTANLTVTGGGGGGGCTGSCCNGGCGGGGGGPSPVITLSSLPHATTQPLAYLYLSQIPYTGLDLGPVGTVLYWVALIGWSLALAYLVLFGAVPLANRRLHAFGARVSEALNSHEAAAATRTHEPAPAPVRPAPAILAAVSSEAPRGYSAYEGFKSLAQNRPLSVEDIVKGLARGSGIPPRASEPAPAPEPHASAMMEEMPRRSPKTEPIYENVEPVYDRVEPIEAPRAPMTDLVPEVPNFITTLLAGNREGVFSQLRAVAMQGGDTEAFLAQVACALDDAYRARLEGASVHPEIARITQSVATPVLERVVTAFATAVDSSYSIGITGAKLALTRALAVLGA
ncbi:MAG TPA: hypothetical protein VMT80_00760 [Candidatus Paceibacterota bacterium]|nr:hypothetical protein [Candidatus Paceibacterota bacterium]